MNKKKKILVLATSSKTRGGITAVINAYKNTSLWNKWDFIWIETHIDRSFFYKVFYFFRAFIQFLCFLPNSGLIHCHLSGPVSSLRKLPFLYLAKLIRKPIIVHFHAFSSESTFDKRFIKLYSIIFRLADKVVVLSQNWKTSICKDLYLPEAKVMVISNPCQKIEKTITNEHVEKIILYAGTINKRKGYHDLINAFSKIDNNLGNWKLVFAGNGELDEARKLVSDLELNERVDFLGWVTNKAKKDVFLKASIFCLPSYAEGFPMAILDAWSYGIPVVTTPVGGIPDVAIHRENMMLFKPGDVSGLQNVLEELMMNEKLQYKLSSASLEFSNDVFSIDKLSNKWNDIYENLVVFKTYSNIKK